LSNKGMIALCLFRDANAAVNWFLSDIVPVVEAISRQSSVCVCRCVWNLGRTLLRNLPGRITELWPPGCHTILFFYRCEM